MRRNGSSRSSASEEAFPDRRVLWLLGAVIPAAGALAFITFDFEHPPGTWWWLGLIVAAPASLLFYLHMSSVWGWRRAVRFAVGMDRRWLWLYAPPRTARERSFSGWLAWVVFCLAAGTFLVIFVAFNIRLLF